MFQLWSDIFNRCVLLSEPRLVPSLILLLLLL